MKIKLQNTVITLILITLFSYDICGQLKGKDSTTTLLPTELNIISSITTNDKTEHFESGEELNRFLIVEIVSEKEFENKRKTAVDFLIADTSNIKKVNGSIELKCQKKNLIFIDKPDAEEDRQEFSYVGQIKFLNKYVIAGLYWESLDYKFIDKISGEETQSFGGYPNISPNKKNIICIYANPYDTTADLEMYSMENNQIKHVMSSSFKNWMPVFDNGEIFWNKNGFLYFTANHINSFWKKDGNLNEQHQYLRIKIL